MGVGLVGEIADKYVVMQEVIVYLIGIATLLIVGWRIVKRVRRGARNTCSGCSADCSVCREMKNNEQRTK